MNEPMADPTTLRMREETGHDCIACPQAVRNLAATAHNALSQWDANQGDYRNPQRFARKMEELRHAVAKMRTVADEHFKALDDWKRP